MRFSASTCFALIGLVMGARGVSVTYYCDSECTQEGCGPPGLVSNPWKAPQGECSQLMSSGYAVKITDCGSEATAETYPSGCSGAEGKSYTVPTGKCVESEGIYSISSCDGSLRADTRRIMTTLRKEFLHGTLNASSHYGDPRDGCLDDESELRIDGVSGAVCAAKCSYAEPCPRDVPPQVTATPLCSLRETPERTTFCALICSPEGADSQCGESASCKPISGLGICTYDDDE